MLYPPNKKNFFKDMVFEEIVTLDLLDTDFKATS